MVLFRGKLLPGTVGASTVAFPTLAPARSLASPATYFRTGKPAARAFARVTLNVPCRFLWSRHGGGTESYTGVMNDDPINPKKIWYIIIYPTAPNTDMETVWMEVLFLGMFSPSQKVCGALRINRNPIFLKINRAMWGSNRCSHALNKGGHSSNDPMN